MVDENGLNVLHIYKTKGTYCVTKKRKKWSIRLEVVFFLVERGIHYPSWGLLPDSASTSFQAKL